MDKKNGFGHYRAALRFQAANALNLNHFYLRPMRLPATLLALLLAAAVFTQVQRVHWQVLNWDNFGYYLHLPAVFKYHDIENYRFAETLRQQYNTSSSLYQITQTPEGQLTPTYTIGMAFLYAPAYAFADVLVRFTHYPADGLSAPYRLAQAAWGWLLSLLALWLLVGEWRRYLNPTHTVLLLAGLIFGTNFFYYFTAEPVSPHNVLFALYGFLVVVLMRLSRQPSPYGLPLIVIICTLLTLARPSEIFSFLLAGTFLLVHGRQQLHSHWWRGLLPAGSAGAVLVLLQVLLWKKTTGHFFYNPYPFKPDFLHPHLLKGLFSFRKGWLLYTPWMGLLFVGFFMPVKYGLKGWKWPVALFLAAQLWTVFAWPMWWYTSSFGMRALVQLYPVFSLGMLAVFAAAEKRRLSWLPGLFTLCCIGWNLFQTWQFHQRIIPLDGNTRIHYLHCLFKTALVRSDYRFLEMQEAPPDESQFSVSVLPDSPAATEKLEIILPGSFGSSTDAVLAHNAAANWWQITANCKQQSLNFGDYQYARQVMEVQRAGKSVYWKDYHLQWLLNDTAKTAVQLPFHLPALQRGDIVKIYCWNNGPDTVQYQLLRVQQTAH
ncbi:MAG: hypothetical protein U0T84_03415 [Chitinophagales bacterium]